MTTQQASNVAEAQTADVNQVKPPAQKNPVQKPRQILDPETDLSFGFAYKDKFVTGMIAIDVLLLSVLLATGKPDSLAISALNALGISLPAAGGYIAIRLRLPYDVARWQAIHDRFPRWGEVLRLFFFSLTMLAATGSCSVALLDAFRRISPQASDFFFITAGTISLVFIFFIAFSDLLRLQKERNTAKDEMTEATPTPPKVQ